MSLDWGEIFGLSVSPWELIIRGSAMYLFLFLVFRVVIRRRIGAVGMADILILVIIADAAQNGMSGDYKSVTEGAILIGTIIGWNVLIDWLNYRVPALQDWLEAPPLLLVDNGRVLHRNLRHDSSPSRSSLQFASKASTTSSRLPNSAHGSDGTVSVINAHLSLQRAP